MAIGRLIFGVNVMSSYLNASNNMIHVTDTGLVRLQQQLQQTEARYLEVCEQRRIAHDLSGDGWHDNPEFNRQQQMEAFLNGELKRLLQAIDKARVFSVQEGSRPVNRVYLGSVVDIEITNNITGDSHIETWEITGHGESDGTQKRLAYDVPLARAIFNLGLDDCSDEFELRGTEVFATVVKLYASRQQSSLGAI
jgi:transcription elongation GreA/GreB family factor